MAKNSGPKKKQQAKETKAEQKDGFFNGIQTWWRGIISELRKVAWPERGKFLTNLAAVLTIIIVGTIVILAFDAFIKLIFDVTGFYNIKQMPAEAPGITAPLNPDDLADEAKEVVEDVEEAADEEKAEDGE